MNQAGEAFEVAVRAGHLWAFLKSNALPLATLAYLAGHLIVWGLR